MENEIVLKIPQINWADTSTWFTIVGVWAGACWAIFGPMLSRSIVQSSNSYEHNILNNKKELKSSVKEEATLAWAISPLLIPVLALNKALNFSRIPQLAGRYLYGRNRT